jgi:hypothetical protein
MAMAIRFVCQHCQNAIQAWDEGNPYYFDSSGKKRYAYHPAPERELCTGVESLHLCLNCGEQFQVDSKAPNQRCLACNSSEIADAFALEGRLCPACRRGTFRRDPNFCAIS